MFGESPASVLTAVADFAADRIASLAPDWSLGAAVEPEVYSQAAELGLFGVELPVAHGGLGLDFGQRVRVFAELAAVDFGFAMSVVNTHNIALNLVRIGTQAQRDAYLPLLLSGRHSACTALTEPGAGTDFGAIATIAREDGSDWVLNGEKSWIVNGRHAGLALVFAQCGAVGDRNGIAGFLVDLTADGVTRYPIDSGFAMTSMGTGGFRLEQVRVPADNRLMAPGRAFKTILTEINAARAYVAAMCDAMLEAALREVQAYGAGRMSFGKPLDAHAPWRRLVDPVAAALAACQAQTREACQQVTAGQDAQVAAMRAKVGSVEACQAHLPALLHAMGAEGLRPERCFTRHLAAAQIAGLTDGATLILKERLARIDGKED